MSWSGIWSSFVWWASHVLLSEMGLQSALPISGWRFNIILHKSSVRQLPHKSFSSYQAWNMRAAWVRRILRSSSGKELGPKSGNLSIWLSKGMYCKNVHCKYSDSRVLFLPSFSLPFNLQDNTNWSGSITSGTRLWYNPWTTIENKCWKDCSINDVLECLTRVAVWGITQGPIANGPHALCRFEEHISDAIEVGSDAVNM